MIMFKLLKHTKPFTFLILAAMIFLFIQAMANLALPDYMSQIVDIGIQQSGIEDAVPEAIRESQMNKLLVFVEGDNRDRVLSKYTLIDSSSEDYQEYIEQYPVLAEQAVYILKEVDQATIDELNPIMAKAFIAVSGIERLKAKADNGVIEFEGQTIPADIDLFKMFKTFPLEQRIEIRQRLTQEFAALGENMLVQSAAIPIRDEYKALGIDIDQLQFNYILRTGGIMLLISIISAISIVIVGFLGSRTGAGLARNLRKSIFTKVESFSKIEMDKFSTSSLITRTTNDVNQIQNAAVIIIRTGLFAPLMGIGGIIRAINKSPSMSWIVIVAVISILTLIIGLFTIAVPKFKVMQKLVDKLNLVTREHLSGLMVIRAFNTENFEEDRFDKANKDLTNTSLFVNRIMVFMFPTMTLIMNGITLLIVWVGAEHIANSSLQVGDMMAFIQYVMQIIFAFLMMSMIFMIVPRASVAAQRVSEVLDTDTVIVDPEDSNKGNEKSRGVVEFNDVSFRYPGAEEDALKNISFKVLPGETTAIIGSTGSGKTTLVNLIPRFYDASKGQILVEGVDVRDMKQEDLRDKIGYVPQKSSLFSGTIESNLRYANENASLEEIKEVAKISQSMEFISKKEEGFQSNIAQGGGNVSGGQKQRLSIARALMKNPEIYLFDDSFSALDFKTDAALRIALKKQTDKSTIIIVAQRISTIMNAEQIIVLDEGEIVGKGTHMELMKVCETYQEIAFSQLSKEELA